MWPARPASKVTPTACDVGDDGGGRGCGGRGCVGCDGVRHPYSGGQFFGRGWMELGCGRRKVDVTNKETGTQASE
eukprot:82381-Chlamydomonas_euryale.AAC.12